MKKISIFLCSIGIVCTLTGCGKTMPELTEEENEVITEYAVNLLLKYDKNYNSRLVDLSAYEEMQDSELVNDDIEEENTVSEDASAEEQDGLPVADTEVIDISEEAPASTIEEFYGIDGFTFQFSGYDLTSEYPEAAEDETDLFFAMEATPGMQLLVLKFQAMNQNGTEKELDMLDRDTRIRIAVNGEASKSALTTMLLNDLQTYKETVGGNESVELVAIVEVPEGTTVESISMILRSDSDNTTISLQ